MRFLIFDTETSGLWAIENDMLQLSYLIVDSQNWKILKTVNHYFPWRSKDRVDPDAIAVNGLTEEFLSKQHLSDRKEAMQTFVQDMNECDAIVAHNFMFDKYFIEETCITERVPFPSWIFYYDTMIWSKYLCKIKKFRFRYYDEEEDDDDFDEYKYPKLTEMAYFLKVKLPKRGLHNSSVDVKIIFECFKALCKIDHFYLGKLLKKKDFHVSNYIIYLTGYCAFDESFLDMAYNLDDYVIELKLSTTQDSNAYITASFDGVKFGVVANINMHKVIPFLNSDGVAYAKMGTYAEPLHFPCILGYSKTDYEESRNNQKRGMKKLIKECAQYKNLDYYKLSLLCKNDDIYYEINKDKDYYYDDITKVGMR